MIKITLTILIFFILNPLTGITQLVGDFRSKATGNWGDYTTWQVYDGASWIDASSGQIPGGTSEADANTVYLEAGFTVTLDADHSCKDLHLNTTADVIRINTQNFNLEVWGKMRFYEGTAPGSSTPNPITSSGITGWITTGASGNIRFRGAADRLVMIQGEVNANNSNSGWNMDFAFDAGFTGQINDRIRAGNITVTSGILFVNNSTGELRVGTNNGSGDTTPNGQFLIKSGATVTGGAGIFKKSTVAAQSITVENGGNIIITNSSYVLAAATLTLDGTVTLQNAINFPTEAGRASAVPVNTFNNLILTGSGAKTLQNNITVNGTLTLGGTSSLSLNSYSLTFGASGTLEYNGSSAQTTSDSEFPSTNGPANLTISNSNGVTLHAARTISNQLSLTSGLFLLGNNDFTLGASSPAVAGSPSVSNMIITNGTGKLIKIFSTTGSFFFPIGENTGTTEYTYAQITVNSASTLDGTTNFGIRVIDNEHPEASGVATDDISRYWEVNTNITGYSYDATFQYLLTDVNGTEGNINTFIYSDETPLASRTPISRVNSTLHQLSISDISISGFTSGANFCNISNNSVSSPTTTVFCNTTSSIFFDGTSATVTSGSPVYQWQQSINNGSWTDISINGQSEDYTESGPLSEGSYQYRRSVNDPTSCLSSDANLSNVTTITDNGNISGNNIGSDQTVSSGGDPAAFTQTASLSGGDGIYSYQWQYSSVSGGPYSDVSSATSATYDIPGGINQTTYFVRQVYSGSCSSTSNEIAITVLPTGIKNHLSQNITIYPNPVLNELYFDLSSFNTEDIQISIYNNKGILLQRSKGTTSSKSVIDMSEYLPGIYFTQLLVDGNKTILYKIIKE